MSFKTLSDSHLEARIDQAQRLLAWLKDRGERHASLAALLERLEAERDRRDAAAADHDKGQTAAR
jgi:hypothetical protein